MPENDAVCRGDHPCKVRWDETIVLSRVTGKKPSLIDQNACSRAGPMLNRHSHLSVENWPRPNSSGWQAAGGVAIVDGLEVGERVTVSGGPDNNPDG